VSVSSTAIYAFTMSEEIPSDDYVSRTSQRDEPIPVVKDADVADGVGDSSEEQLRKSP
jgi:hypothetical protein